MFENAVQKRLAQQNKDIAISVPERLVGLLLIEIAWSRGLEAWPDEEIPATVWILCTQDEVEEILALSETAGAYLRLQELQALKAAVILAGGEPSKELMDSIETVEDQCLGCFSEKCVLTE